MIGLVLNLIGSENGASFINQSQSEATQNWAIPNTFDNKLIIALKSWHKREFHFYVQDNKKRFWFCYFRPQLLKRIFFKNYFNLTFCSASAKRQKLPRVAPPNKQLLKRRQLNTNKVSLIKTARSQWEFGSFSEHGAEFSSPNDQNPAGLSTKTTNCFLVNQLSIFLLIFTHQPKCWGVDKKETSHLKIGS